MADYVVFRHTLGAPDAEAEPIVLICDAPVLGRRPLAELQSVAYAAAAKGDELVYNNQFVSLEPLSVASRPPFKVGQYNWPKHEIAFGDLEA